jgi:hypothetical protein
MSDNLVCPALVLAGVALAACANLAAPAPGAVPKSTANSAGVTSSASPPPISPPSPRSPSVAPTISNFSPLPALPWSFTKVRTDAATSLAVGTPPKAGVMGGQRAAVFDGERWRDLPDVPLPPNTIAAALWFGRDNEPRVMGYSGPESQNIAQLKPIYLRYKQGRWAPEPGELGRLGAPVGALYGVLGFQDPEVVCRPTSVCLIKRTSGWSSIPAHSAPVHVLLAGGTAWALEEHRVQRLAPSGFAELEPARPWQNPRGLWADADNIWVSEANPPRLYRLRAAVWSACDVPIREPRALWGDASGGIWLAGDGGVAYFDGAAFRVVTELPGPLAFIVPNGNELWLAGAAGVFRGVPVPVSAAETRTR